MLLLSRIQKAATASVTADMRMMLLLDVGGKKITVLRGDKIIILRSDLVNPLFDRAGGLVANRIGNLLQSVIVIAHLQDDPILFGQPFLELVDLDRGDNMLLKGRAWVGKVKDDLSIHLCAGFDDLVDRHRGCRPAVRP